MTVPVERALAKWSWSTPLSFCEPWPFGFQLLGQEEFLRFFRMLLVASDSRLEIELDRG